MRSTGRRERRHPLGIASCRSPWLLCLSVVLAMGRPARAFDELMPPDYLRPGDWLVVTDSGGEVGVEADYLRESQKSDGSGTARFRNRSLEEYVEYRLNGYSYHPRFLTFRTRLRLGMLQQRIERSGLGGTDDATDSSNTFLREYDVYLKFLKEHPVSVDLFARRDYDVVRQLFSDRISLESEDWGGFVHSKRGPVPMDFSFRQNRLWQEGVRSRSEWPFARGPPKRCGPPPEGGVQLCTRHSLCHEYAANLYLERLIGYVFCCFW